jgi:DegV family protein with EDD domain
VAIAGERWMLITDSCCDLPLEIVERFGIAVLSFPFTLDQEEHLDDLGDSLPHSAFYDALRAGAWPTTAQVPLVSYLSAFRSAAESRTPAVFLSFSSALSGTYDSVLIARDAVLAEFPDAEIHTVDTKTASAAQGLLVLEAARKRRDGATAAETAEWTEFEGPRVNGYFTLEELEHLRRGGRISDVAAVAGSVLDVRPVLRLDRKGALVVDGVSRGRKKSMRLVADAFAARAEDPAHNTVVVAHANCEEDADRLEAMLRERTTIGEIMRMEVGPVIGSHTGPGMIACAFWGTERER